MRKKLSFLLYFGLILLIGAACKNAEHNGENPDNKSDEKISTELPWSVRLMESFRLTHPGAVTYDEVIPKKQWSYEQGLMLEAFKRMYEKTGDENYYNFIKDNLEQYITDEGIIKTYNIEDYNLDKINPGRALLFMYEKTGKEKYKIAADTLRKQLENQPRTENGGFWHKKIYPYQMWLDGLYMAEPFYAMYTKRFENGENYDDIIHQFVNVYNHTLDEETGLLYHAWNENKEQKWADPETGKAPNVWGRAMGWYMMAIVDVLDILPKDYAKRDTLISILQNVSEALLKYRDEETGLWYQIIDKGDKEGNYLESSCATMFTYAFAKGANEGYLDNSFLDAAKEAFDQILDVHVTVDENGFVNLHNTCTGAGLGGDPYRDGSFEYYMSVPKATNDQKGYGPFIFAAIELEKEG